MEKVRIFRTDAAARKVEKPQAKRSPTPEKKK